MSFAHIMPKINFKCVSTLHLSVRIIAKTQRPLSKDIGELDFTTAWYVTYENYLPSHCFGLYVSNSKNYNTIQKLVFKGYQIYFCLNESCVFFYDKIKQNNY